MKQPGRIVYYTTKDLTTQYDARVIKQAPLLHKRYLLDEKMAKKLLLKFWCLSQSQRHHLQVNNIDYKDICEPNKTDPEG